MVPLVTDATGLDPLVLALFAALTSMAGFVARQWIKDRDYERQICREDREKLEAKLDAYEERSRAVSTLVTQTLGHTDPKTGDPPTNTQRRKIARTRPRGPGNA